MDLRQNLEIGNCRKSNLTPAESRLWTQCAREEIYYLVAAVL